MVNLAGQFKQFWNRDASLNRVFIEDISNAGPGAIFRARRRLDSGRDNGSSVHTPSFLISHCRDGRISFVENQYG
jgi:hypothetical protein